MHAPLTDSHDSSMTVRAADNLNENQSLVPSIANNSAMRQSGDKALQFRRAGRSVVFVKVMDRPVAAANGEAISGRDGGACPRLGVAHGGLHVLALGETRGNC
jgi:hypothetical protein